MNIRKHLREIRKHGFIQPEIPVKNTDIVIGSFEKNDRVKLLHTLFCLYKEESDKLFETGSEPWKAHLASTRASVCQTILLEQLVSLFGKIAYEKANEMDIKDCSIELRKNWEVVVAIFQKTTH